MNRVTLNYTDAYGSWVGHIDRARAERIKAKVIAEGGTAEIVPFQMAAISSLLAEVARCAR